MRCPTKQELLEHNRTHTPFRSWCPFCVAGRGPTAQHRRGENQEGGDRNDIALDYFFLRDEAGGESQPVLGLRDRRTGLYGAHTVPFKGAGSDWIARQIGRDVGKCGYHGRVVLRGDGEHALQDVLQEKGLLGLL